MKQEKLCEAEDMSTEELGSENNFWVEKAIHNAKVNEKMGVVYAQHKATRDKQVGGDHYKRMKVQPWDVVDTAFTCEQAVGFYKGNALKYIMRAGSKGPVKEDIQKALHYLEKLLEIL